MSHCNAVASSLKHTHKNYRWIGLFCSQEKITLKLTFLSPRGKYGTIIYIRQFIVECFLALGISKQRWDFITFILAIISTNTVIIGLISTEFSGPEIPQCRVLPHIVTLPLSFGGAKHAKAAAPVVFNMSYYHFLSLPCRDELGQDTSNSKHK